MRNETFNWVMAIAFAVLTVALVVRGATGPAALNGFVAGLWFADAVEITRARLRRAS